MSFAFLSVVSLLVLRLVSACLSVDCVFAYACWFLCVRMSVYSSVQLTVSCGQAVRRLVRARYVICRVCRYNVKRTTGWALCSASVADASRRVLTAATTTTTERRRSSVSVVVAVQAVMSTMLPVRPRRLATPSSYCCCCCYVTHSQPSDDVFAD